MPENQRQAITRFLQDGEVSNVVRAVLSDHFQKAPKERDVQYLAASWLAKELFDQAWADLYKYQSEPPSESKVETNIGL